MSGAPTHRAKRAITADDEPRLAAYLADKLAIAWPELDIVGIAANGPEALRLMSEHDPDVLFLDIRMPGLSGLDVAAAPPPAFEWSLLRPTISMRSRPLNAKPSTTY